MALDMMAAAKRALRRVLRRDGPDQRLTTYRDRYRLAAALSVLPLPLPRILALFGSDKQRADGHAYGDAYAGVFAPFRYRPVKVLEIGVLSGDSLLAWRCFFPRGTTIALDIEEKAELAGDRTRFYRADQGSAADLDRVCRAEGPFDIVVDDGSHRNHHQLFSFRHVFPWLKPGGVYVIEDVQTSFWPIEALGIQWDGKAFDDPDFAKTCYGEFLELAKYLNHAEFVGIERADPQRLAIAKQIKRIAFEHNMIVAWKGANDLPSNVLGRATP